MRIHAVRPVEFLFLLVTVTIVLAALACTPAYVTEERELEKLARRSMNPTNLQAWAQDYLSTYQDDDAIPVELMPSQIREMFEQEPTAYVMEEKPGERSVMIVWGGGFGHRGFWIGQPQFKAKVEERPLFLVQWIPGLYFCTQNR